jgi:prepilin-type processing-associated H-X9-DG protein
VFILPFIEQQALFNAWNSLGSNNPSGGPYDSYLRYAGAANTTVTFSQVNSYVCPSDPSGGKQRTNSSRYHNYAVNYGDTDQAQTTAYNIVSPVNKNITARYLGAPFTDMGSPNVDDTGYATGFATTQPSTIASITDGVSNTLMASELRIASPQNDSDLRGFTWWGPSASFNTIIPPNSTFPDAMGNGGCAVQKPPCNGNLTAPGAKYALIYLGARSYHAGGVNASMCDGSVRFIKDSINLLTWMGLGTTQGAEVISSDAY